jgi:hypothetical protein
MLRPRLTFANVIACTALFVALGGTGYAAFKLPRNSVGKPQLRRDAVDSSRVKDHSLLAVDFKSGQLAAATSAATGATGPAGATGPTGPTGAAGTAGPAGRSGTDGTNGTNGTDGMTGPAGPFPSTLPAGKTIRGDWAVFSQDGSVTYEFDAISFVYPLQTTPTVVIVPRGGPYPASCPGTSTHPAALSGYACIFVGFQSNATSATVNSYGGSGTGYADVNGLIVTASATSTAGAYEIEGTWAVTGD